MDAAWALGITHFDTADAYGGGRSEAAIGRWIKSRGQRPTITSKTFNPMAEGADHGLAPARIARRLESSLERLQVDHIDLYLAHDFDPDVPLADTLAAFERHAEASRIRAYGVSNFTVGQLELALQTASPLAIQNSYSLLEQGDRGEVLPLCTERDVAYLVFSPRAGGWLTGKYRRGRPFPAGSRMTQRPEPYRPFENDATFDRLEGLQELATERGTSSAGLALAWLLDDARIAQVVIGSGRPEHLEPVAEALQTRLTDDERVRLEELFTA
jgi:aryl-alcohol dehydrogenase-like predicted oxidoreductase